MQSIEQSFQTGATFSSPHALTSDAEANELGIRFFGPVVIITDALAYSATEVFCAGAQDHGIATILGVHTTTGGGGGTIVSSGRKDSLLVQLLREEDSPFKALDSDVGMTVAWRRLNRVRKNEGLGIEDFGIRCDEGPHRLTRDDVLKNNVDLKAAAVEIIEEKLKAELKNTNS